MKVEYPELHQKQCLVAMVTTEAFVSDRWMTNKILFRALKPIDKLADLNKVFNRNHYWCVNQRFVIPEFFTD